MHLVIAGNTGSGKTTIAKELAKRFELPLIGSGDVARMLSETDAATSLALQQGAQAPEQPMRAEIRRRIEEADATRGGWILDGFPRTVEQLICLMQWTAAMPVFIHIDADPWTCLERLVARNRAHDNPDAIARRFDFYESDTTKMLALLRSGFVLNRIKVGDEMEQIVQDVERWLS